MLEVQAGQLGPAQAQIEGQAQQGPVPGRLGVLPLF
jgi:hypothetical protein